MKLKSFLAAILICAVSPITAFADGEGATGLNCQIKYPANQNWIEFRLAGKSKDKFGLAGDKQTTFTKVEYGTAKTLGELKQRAVASVQWDDDANAYVMEPRTVDTVVTVNPQGTLGTDLFVRFQTKAETSNAFFQGADLTSVSCHR
jgi:hypothetical protein